jgi:hypothetical protein
MMRGEGLVTTRIKLLCNLVDEIPERGHGLDQIQKSPNEHEKVTVRTVVQLASGDDKFRRCGFLVGASCNLTINLKTSREVSQCPIVKIPTSMLADNIKSRGSGSNIEKSSEDGINRKKVLGVFVF